MVDRISAFSVSWCPRQEYDKHASCLCGDWSPYAGDWSLEVFYCCKQSMPRLEGLKTDGRIKQVVARDRWCRPIVRARDTYVDTKTGIRADIDQDDKRRPGGCDDLRPMIDV